MKQLLLDFYRDEEGMQTIEMVILLVVVVSIAFAFRKTLLNWYTKFVTESVDAPAVGTPVSPQAPGQTN